MAFIFLMKRILFSLLHMKILDPFVDIASENAIIGPAVSVVDDLVRPQYALLHLALLLCPGHCSRPGLGRVWVK